MNIDSIVLVSGGLDSCVTAALALREGPAGFLHVNYGQRTTEREERAFNEIATHYGIEERLVVDISYLREMGGSALTDTAVEVPEGDLGRRGVPSTYVPFRNANLLSMATSWAEVTGASEIYIGAVEEDSAGYPDCRKEFFEAFNRVVELGTKRGGAEGGIRIMTPLIDMRKSEIVRLGLRLGAPLGLTWSCYADSEEACGRCDSCLLRLRGFEEAGSADPIPYRSHAG